MKAKDKGKIGSDLTSAPWWSPPYGPPRKYARQSLPGRCRAAGPSPGQPHPRLGAGRVREMAEPAARSPPVSPGTAQQERHDQWRDNHWRSPRIYVPIPWCSSCVSSPWCVCVLPGCSQCEQSRACISTGSLDIQGTAAEKTGKKKRTNSRLISKMTEIKMNLSDSKFY